MQPKHPLNIAIQEECSNPLIQKLLAVVEQEHSIHWVPTLPLNEVDTCLIFTSYPYSAEELPLISLSIKRAKELLQDKLKPEALILIIFVHNVKVDFPERKLNREITMSEAISGKTLERELPRAKERVHILHVFGPYHFKECLRFIKGNSLFIETIIQ